MIDDLEVKPSTSSSLSADFIANLTSIGQGRRLVLPMSHQVTLPPGHGHFREDFLPGANLQDPANIRYDIPGTYNVSLKISNGSGSDSITRSGYITVTGHPSYMSLDFESLADFTLTFDPVVSV